MQFRPGTAEDARAEARNAVGALSRALTNQPDGAELLMTSLTVDQAIAALQALPQIEVAEPNWIVRHFATSNDQYYTNGSLWGMYGDATSPSNQYGSQAGELWAKGHIGSTSVYVGVIDSGIDYNHPDLSSNIWTNPFDPVDGVDNDGNGRIDDIHGWDFFNNDSSVYDGSPGNTSVDAHGTHVAGTIGARGGNGIGVAGVNWNVRIISAKFLGPNGGTTAAAVSAVEYITDLKTRHGLNIIATNNSWGGSGYSTTLHQAIIKAAKQGILFVAAAGNAASNNDSVMNYPSNFATNVAAGSESAATYDAVIAVASITSAGALSSFSNYGVTTVDIGAPGSGIYSTTPQNGYSSYNGTSMATPHVTGAAAMYKSINTSFSAEQIRAAILNQGASTASLAGKTLTGKRLNIGDFAVAPNLTINDATVIEGNSGTKSATFTASLSALSSSAVTVNYATADGTATGSTTSTTASNTAGISIPVGGSATPYPSTITVSSGIGTISKLTATLTGFSHEYPQDVDVLLVGPTGQAVVLMSDVGSGADASNLTFTFDDAGGWMPSSGALSSGTFRPTDYSTGGDDAFAGPAPGGPYGSTLAGFNGTNPAGEWRLFVTDDVGSEGGSASGGWSLTATTTTQSSDYVSASGVLTISAGSISGTAAVTINGDTTPESSETFKVHLSSASGANITDGEGVGTILNDEFTDSLLSGIFIKAAHITELRTLINELRAIKGLGAFSFTDSTLTTQTTVVKAVHITELRTALSAIYAAAGQAAPSYTDDPLIAGASVIKAAHITEIRDKALNAP